MKKQIFYFLVVVIGCISCKPINHSIGIREVYQYTSVSNYEQKKLPSLTEILQVHTQVFFIDSKTDTILYGTEGTVITIQPSCLRTSNSQMYEGKITILLKELYTKQALLRERACTISNGNMLESDGSLYIHAQTESGVPLFIECENAVEIYLPREVQKNMTYFNGVRDSRGNMNWELSDSIQPINQERFLDDFENNPYYLPETGQEIQSYFFTTKSFGWINCDRFYEDARQKMNLSASFILPTDVKNITETYNYIVFDSLMTVLPIYLDEFGQWICPSLPVGEAVTCISIQKSDTRLYCGIQKTEVGRSGLLIQLKEVKEQELKVLLDFSL